MSIKKKMFFASSPLKGCTLSMPASPSGSHSAKSGKSACQAFAACKDSKPFINGYLNSIDPSADSLMNSKVAARASWKRWWLQS
jgi:hypothetical protein